MKPDFGFLSGKPGKLTNAGKPGFLARFIRDERGSYIAFMALLLPALVTIAALGSEGGYYLYNHRVLQSAADNAAYSAATALAINSNSTSGDLLSGKSDGRHRLRSCRWRQWRRGDSKSTSDREMLYFFAIYRHKGRNRGCHHTVGHAYIVQDLVFG